jgi:acetyl-CoA acetyltransferase
VNVNRLCGSGLQAIVAAAGQLLLADATVIVAGCNENMSRQPFLDYDARAGWRLGTRELVDGTLALVTDPFGRYPMGETAERVAQRYSVTREDQDQFDITGYAPALAVPKVLAKLQIKPEQLDVIEFNEAFAAQAVAVIRATGLDQATVNPMGGAIAYGHPIGATGALLTVRLMYELERLQQRLGMVTMCIGGRQGIAAVFEWCAAAHPHADREAA